jgi:hypothetical protein
MNADEAARQLGIDLSLIAESLRLTPEQRAIQHQRALELALQLQTAYRAHLEKAGDERTQQTTADVVRR